MKNGKFALVAILVLTMICASCGTGRGRGAALGGGAGALIGGLAGGWRGAAIGTGIGIASGYIIGNEADEARARRYSSVPTEELQPLAGMTWRLLDLQSAEEIDVATFVGEFRSDGTLVTTRTNRAGETETNTEKYRIVGDILIVFKPGQVLNFTYSLSAGTLIVTADGIDGWKATFTKVS